MQEASKDPDLKIHMKQLTTLTKQFMKNAHSLPEILDTDGELESLKDAESFLSNEYGCKVSVMLETDGKHDKAANASPGKPAIVIE